MFCEELVPNEANQKQNALVSFIKPLINVILKSQVSWVGMLTQKSFSSTVFSRDASKPL